MAKCKAHGTEIGTVHFITYAKRYMSDGVILKNYGFGWKIAGKVKAEVAPLTAYQNQVKSLAEKMTAAPAHAAYRKALHDLAGVNKRWKLHAAVQLMPDDPDGVWSEACDGYGDNVHADIDDVVALCAAFRAIPARS